MQAPKGQSTHGLCPGTNYPARLANGGSIIVLGSCRLRLDRSGFRFGRRFTPEYRLDAQLALLLDEAAKIVAQDFAKGFIDHRGIGFRADRVAELPLDGGESRFDIAPFVVVGQELLPPVLEVMEHLLEQATYPARCVALERDVPGPAAVGYRLEVLVAGVSLVCGDFLDREILFCRLDQWGELRGVRRVLVENPNRRHHVGFHADRDMR